MFIFFFCLKEAVMEMETITVHVATITYLKSFGTSQHGQGCWKEKPGSSHLLESWDQKMWWWNFHAVQISAEITLTSYSYC